MPIRIAPAARSRATAGAVSVGVKAKSGQAAVVGRPATSMLSFTAKGTPHSGLACGSKAPSASAAASASASGTSARKMPGSSISANRR